tara:strand:+ start:1849 stop:4938 length:3090 start_codon:yes stop_codon:yes gene_type:complete
MSKQALELSTFHNGLNSKTNNRDIQNDELALCTNMSVDDVGKLTMTGGAVEQSSSGLTLDTLSDGYSLFRFSSDYATNGTTQTETDYLIAWDDTEGKLYWLPGTTTWATPSHLDLSSDWGTTEGCLPVFYYVDGALRISDGNLGNTNNPSQWIGTINRTLFPGASSYQGGNCAIGGWYKEKQELLEPTVGKISGTAPTQASDLQTDGVYWHLRNLREYTDSVYTFAVASTTPGIPGSYTQSEQISNLHGDSSSGITDEQWMTVQKGTDGYADSNYHDYGVALHGEDDDEGQTYTWTIASAFNTGGSAVTFGSGQSLYVAVRMAGEEQKQMWDGTHTKSLSGESSIAITISDAYITFNESSGNDFLKYHIDHTQFTDSTTPSAQWHILELPYDEAYEADINDTFAPQKIKLEMNVTWTRTGNIYSNGTGTGSPSPYASYKLIPGWSLIQLSDLRVGDTDLVGVTTYGKQKFLMSNTFDETNNESLLYDFGGGASQEVVLDNTTSTYKIGISAYVKVPSNSFNKRISGANLYIDDEGIPYRIAQLRYMKGLKGAWEAEYPKQASDKFTESVGTNEVNVTGIVKTDGLPLLESYESMNGFSPGVNTLASSYKTAVVLNRKTYIANIYQDSKVYGDRMIKSNANSFDIFPSEGKYIDVVQNDGDSIVKLEAYADRILQFKKDIMYLINATRDSEYLEDTFVGKGIAAPSASTKTDIGVAWANENGAYLYDGQRVHNLTEGKIKESDWETFITPSTDVTYVPLKNKIIVTGNTDGDDVYEYTFFTKSWTNSTSKLATSKTNFVIDSNKSKYIASNNGEVYYWDDGSASSSEMRVITKDFTFGNPASRKKCFKFYLTYKSNGASNVKVFYGTNGANLQATKTVTTDLDDTVGSGDTFEGNPKVLRLDSTTGVSVGDVVSGHAGIPANSYVTEILSGTLLKINNDSTADVDNVSVLYSHRGTEVATTSKFAGTSDSCYSTAGLATTSNDWKQAELVPPSSVNNIYSVQLQFASSGTTPASFEIGDITIVYREKPLK